MNQSINQSIKFIQPFLQMIKSAHRAAVEKKTVNFTTQITEKNTIQDLEKHKSKK